MRRGAVSSLLEREQELASIEVLAQSAAHGDARVAIVEGPAGIGKTRLLAEVRARAADAGVRVLAGRGGELEREYGFGVVRQLFEPALAAADAPEHLLRGAAEAARPIFGVPEEQPAQEGPGDGSFAALHGLYWLTVNLSAEHPLLLAVDDLHWCDHPSLRFLAYLVRRLEGLPVTVACSLRPAEPGVDTALVAEIASDPLTVSIRPRTLSLAAAAELVSERLDAEPEPAFVDACHSATGGNPLLLSELLKALAAEGARPDAAHIAFVRDLGPRAASRAVLLRLARLRPEAVAVARAVAVLGDGAELAAAAALAGLDEQAAARATGELVRAEILRPEPPLGFVHPLVGAAVHFDIAPGERELHHARAAQLLADAGAPPEQIAAHLLSIAPRGEATAVETLRRAAASALAKGATESAVSYLARALAEPPAPEARPQVLFELGWAEALTSGPAAAEHLREAYETLPDPQVRGIVARILCLTLLQTGSREESAAVARRAAAVLPPELSDLREALEAFELATALFGVGEPTRIRVLERYRDRREFAGPGARMLSALAAVEWTYACGPADACSELAIAALGNGELIAADNGFLSIGPIFVLDAAERDEALLAWDASLADAHRRGSLYSVSSIHLWHGWSLLRRGDVAEAQDELELAVEEFRDWGFGLLANLYISGFLTTVLVERGDLAGARRVATIASDPGLVADGVRYWLNGRLELEVAEGRWEDAVATGDELGRRFAHVLNPAFDAWRSLKAQALDRLGRREEAFALVEEELELARRWGAPGPVGRALRVLGLLEGGAGLPRLEEAAELLAGSAARLEHAKTLAALGGALRRGRRPSDAREPLRQALELADVCGATGLVEQVRAELYAAGARPRTTALRGVESLTASERRVASLAAEGQTNRDIAQTLFVTPKTVEVHLSSAYRKLGIRSRRELAAALLS